MTGSSGELKKELGIVKVFCISSGAMISSGLFVLPALVYLKAGPSIILAYIFAAILVIPAMLSKAELATAMPKSGGVFFFIQRSLGPLFGTFAGFASWISLSLKSAFALVGIGVFLQPLVPTFGADSVKIIAVCVTLIFTILNVLSVRQTGTVQVVMVFSLMAILLLYIFMGLGHIDVHRYVPFAPGGWMALFTVTGMIFVSFGGLTKIASVAEEVKNPGRTIPTSMFSAFAVVTLFYALTLFVTVGLLGKADFESTLIPISLGAFKFTGNVGWYVLSAAGMLAFITTANSGLLAASRDPLAMARDHLLPSFFSRVNLRFKTPVVSILTTSLFMIAVIVLLDIESLIKVASTMKLLLFTFTNVSVIMMRESKIVSYKPAFKAPLYPYIHIAGIVVYILLVLEMGRIPLLIALVFFVVSLLWYFLYSRSRNLRDSALINIVERVISGAIKSRKLTDELRDILMERDEIVEDRFDRIIKNAEILDIEEQDMDGLFTVLADVFSSKFQMPALKINELLREREKDSTTAIHPGLAIPHIVLDGSSRFDIAVVRSKKGIRFGQNTPAVRVVFALAGSKDERNFHLQALMAIAQIVQDTEFINNWVKAGSIEDLRSLILLAQRVRKAEV
jgi:APA family basic amino acid/polyamine antiporter